MENIWVFHHTSNIKFKVINLSNKKKEINEHLSVYFITDGERRNNVKNNENKRKT